jgi:ribose 5-phosphate isomerase B
MIITIGSDHGGYNLKLRLIDYLESKYTVVDKGCYGEESCDYPEYARLVANEISGNGNDGIGILICGTGIGISIAANKIKGIRCALCNDVYSAEMAKKHNNANIIALGAKIIDYELAIKIIDTFVAAEFEGGRHQRRVALIDIT